MYINIVDKEGCKYVTFVELKKHLKRDVYSTIKLCEDAVKKRLDYTEENIHLDSLLFFLRWYGKTYSQDYATVCGMLKAIKTPKRKYSTTHRIHIAYKSKYKCNKCDVLLPPEFEVDHIKELRDGGKDEYDNLQALCPNCHAEKTRVNTLKKSKIFAREFKKRSRIMEENAFLKFQYKKSKYF